MGGEEDTVIDTERDDDRTPWTPPGMGLPQVGDRVRVLPRPECEYCAGSEAEDRKLGEVVEVESFSEPSLWGADAQAHPYWVEFDVPLPDGCNSPHAASELEIVADDAE